MCHCIDMIVCLTYFRFLYILSNLSAVSVGWKSLLSVLYFGFRRSSMRSDCFEWCFWNQLEASWTSRVACKTRDKLSAMQSEKVHLHFVQANVKWHKISAMSLGFCRILLWVMRPAKLCCTYHLMQLSWCWDLLSCCLFVVCYWIFRRATLRDQFCGQSFERVLSVLCNFCLYLKLG